MGNVGCAQSNQNQGIQFVAVARQLDMMGSGIGQQGQFLEEIESLKKELAEKDGELKKANEEKEKLAKELAQYKAVQDQIDALRTDLDDQKKKTQNQSKTLLHYTFLTFYATIVAENYEKI